MRLPQWLTRRSASDTEDVREELDTHVALRVEENLARGMTPEDARHEAERRLGPTHEVTVELGRLKRRQRSLSRALATDLRQAVLCAVRAPLPTTAGVAVTAIGLGTVGAAWLLASVLFHRPPAAVVRPHELYSVMEGTVIDRATLMTYRRVDALRQAVPDAALFAWGERELQVVHRGVGRVLRAALVTSGYFEVLGITPAEGRLLDAADARRRRQVCVISARVARGLGQTASLGESLLLNGQWFEIVGIAPSPFHGLEPGHPVDVWVPLEIEPVLSTVSTLPDGRSIRGYNEGNMGWLRGGVRIAADRSPASLAAQLTAAAKAAAPNAEVRERTGVVLSDRIWLSPWPIHRERLRSVLTPLTVAALLTIVLTSACSSSLFLGRVLDRRGEFATRLALGAPRLRNVRLVAFEVLAVVSVGLVLAAAVTYLLLQAGGRLVVFDGIRIEDAVTSVDARAVGDFFFLGVVAAALTLIGPMAVAARTSNQPRPCFERGSTAGHVMRRLLLAMQVAGGCALLAGAGLLTQSLSALRNQPLGFDPYRVAFVELNPSGAGLSDEERRALVPRLVEGHSAMVGVAVADELPFGGATTIFVRGEGARDSRTYPLPVTRINGPYFAALGIRLVSGRAFDPRDTGRPVAVISAPFAESLWPGQNAVGRTLRVGSDQGGPIEIVGVVDGLRDASLRGQPMPRIYLPLGPEFGRLVVLARHTEPAAAAAALVESVQGIDARLVPIQAGVVGTLVQRTLEQRNGLRMISGIIGLGSLLMVAIGTWGLAHGTLRRRWREFGVRQALGATPRHIGRLVLRDAWMIGVTGSAAGALAAWQFGRALQAWLFGVSPHDPLILSVASLVVALSALAGAALPARAAMTWSPATLLRDQ